jgi:group I intron endonuclease
LLNRAITKYGHENFSVAILEYCTQENLDSREQYWLDLLKPDYNILKFSRSSRGYKHTSESIAKMKGPRPNFKPSPELLRKLMEIAKTRQYTPEYRDKVSKREGKTVYVYDSSGKLINTYSSIIRLKKAYGLTMHHKTLYKNISQGMLFNNHTFSFIFLVNSDLPDSSIANSSLVLSSNSNKLKARKIKVSKMENNLEIYQTFSSLNSAASYIKIIDGSVDKETMRKYINSGKLYKKK